MPHLPTIRAPPKLLHQNNEWRKRRKSARGVLKKHARTHIWNERGPQCLACGVLESLVSLQRPLQLSQKTSSACLTPSRPCKHCGVCQYLCAHTWTVWLSSQNWGQIALRCSYFGISFFLLFVFILLPLSPLFPLYSLVPCPLSQVSFLPSYPRPSFHSIALSFSPRRVLERPFAAGQVWGRELAPCLFMYRIDYFQLDLDGASLHWYQSLFASFVGRQSGGVFTRSSSLADTRAPLSTKCESVSLCLMGMCSSGTHTILKYSASVG